ncbi:UDP-N-acetylmuramate dehydrogenase [Weissella coleopterorum]|uniref:UDP-N-acetylenolpyruvoylglucosamine reductase n=1 Tax=Weissella coleopterorum TaxID=2714949 RepID=A0A6G8AZ30_9LACO|nr:UDP-N-acetylmuramate dehydrogenase [Weissella coleopterorum]QIL50351.1 UDP-N-acetylmuramate dehydrogenase [Weissella coleopterorum]
MTINLQAKFPGFDIKSHEKLAPYTNTQVGGPAEWVFWPHRVQELIDVLALVRQEKMPVTVLGNASNLVIGDAGLEGLVIFLSHLNQITINRDDQTLKAGAGVPLIDVTQAALQDSLSGIEWAAGIPGSVGGAVYMNAGAYGGESADWISSITVLTPTNEIKTYQNVELDFGYRHSLVQTTGDVILDATFKLVPGEFKAIEMLMEDFNTRRALRQPLEYPSCGSTFKRPEGYYAGRLIMDAGLQGFTIGGAQVSTKHAGFIVNVNHATAADYIAVIRQVQAVVAQKFDVQLETEVRIFS